MGAYTQPVHRDDEKENLVANSQFKEKDTMPFKRSPR